MFLQVLIMAVVLGGASFAVGMLPLSYTFSKGHLERLSVLGTGLLLGAALGVIIPEGVEAVTEDGTIPTSRIATCLIAGFILMVVIEELIAPNAHAHSLSVNDIVLPMHKTAASQVEFDVDTVDMDVSDPSSRQDDLTSSHNANTSGFGNRAFALLLGLVIHAAADGLALGVANLAPSEDGRPNPVSFVVFLALMLHKAPTALAFTTSLLSTSLPRPNCKKYVVIFSSSTPLSAIASYLIFDFLGGDRHSQLTGTALLVSGGSFLYVATVLQQVSHLSTSSGDMGRVSRVSFIATGMLIPLVLTAIIGHGH